MKYSWKGRKNGSRHKNRIKRGGQARQKHTPQHPHHVKVSLRGTQNVFCSRGTRDQRHELGITIGNMLLLISLGNMLLLYRLRKKKKKKKLYQNPRTSAPQCAQRPTMPDTWRTLDRSRPNIKVAAVSDPTTTVAHKPRFYVWYDRINEAFSSCSILISSTGWMRDILYRPFIYWLHGRETDSIDWKTD